MSYHEKMKQTATSLHRKVSGILETFSDFGREELLSLKREIGIPDDADPRRVLAGAIVGMLLLDYHVTPKSDAN